MCPPRTDQTKIDTTRTEGTEIEVKPPESCLTYQLQVTIISSLWFAWTKERVWHILNDKKGVRITVVASTSVVVKHPHLGQFTKGLHKWSYIKYFTTKKDMKHISDAVKRHKKFNVSVTTTVLLVFIRWSNIERKDATKFPQLPAKVWAL